MTKSLKNKMETLKEKLLKKQFVSIIKYKTKDCKSNFTFEIAKVLQRTINFRKWELTLKLGNEKYFYMKIEARTTLS